MRNWITTGIFLVATAAAQTQAFEAASVRPTGPKPPFPIPEMFLMTGGPGSPDPGNIHFTNVPLQQLMLRAYGLKQRYQLSAPSWMETARFDIVAKLPPDTTEAKFEGMLQALLIDRFNMTMHSETKTVPGYTIIVAKGGPRIHQRSDSATSSGILSQDPTPRSPVRTQVGKDGYKELAPGTKGIIVLPIQGGTRLSAQGQPMSQLASFLENPLGQPVVDNTGLGGTYDFNLTFSRDERTSANVGGDTGAPSLNPPAGDAPPDLFVALQAQLGLKLDKARVPILTVVIDTSAKSPRPD